MATKNAINSNIPIEVSLGGSGVVSITDHSLVLGSGTAAMTVLGEASNGQLPIGSTGADPVLGAISGGTGIDVTNGAGTISLAVDTTVAASFPTDSGTATPSSSALTMTGGTNINTSGAAAAVTVNLDAAIAGMTSVDFATAGRIGTATSAGNTLLIQAYDVDGTAYTTFATLTANNDPTMDLDDAVTKGGQYIYRAGGTDVPVTDGGTGAGTLEDHGVLVGSGTAAVAGLTVGTNGQVLLGSTGADPVFATLASSGSTIAFTPGAGTLNLETGSAVAVSVTTDSGSAVPSSGVLTIAGGTNVTTAGAGSTVTINASGGGLSWTEVTGTTQAIAVNSGYILNNAGLVTATLPATATVGDTIRIIGLGAGGWKIAQNASQYIRWDENAVTTTGVGGSFDSTDDHDAVELICTVTDVGFGVLTSKGNISYT